MPRGRPRKDAKTASESSTDNLTTVTASNSEDNIMTDNAMGPTLFQRDENGLLKNVQYIFNEDGSVNWRAMIKDEQLFPNRSWFGTRKLDVPKSIDGLKDHQLNFTFTVKRQMVVGTLIL